MTDHSQGNAVDPMAGDTVALIRSTLDTVFGGAPVRRVLLIAPPDGDASMFHREVALRKRYHNHPQYGLGVVATVLRGDGLDVAMVNVNHEILVAARAQADPFDFDAVVRGTLLEALDGFDADLIAVTCMYSQAHRALVQTLDIIRAHCPDTPLSLGGVHPTNTFVDLSTRAAFLRDIAPVDILMLYEAEYSFRDLLRVVNGRAEPDILTQVVFPKTDPMITLAERRRPEGGDLNIIPALDLMKVGEMSRVGRVGAFYSLKPEETVFATSLFGRGCRFHCTFCSVRHFNGVGVRSRSVDTVLDELERMTTEFGVTHVSWLDDDFFYNKHRTLELINGIVRRGLDLTWDCSNGVVAAACTEELIAGAAESGCIGVYLGIESGNPEILKSIEKPGTVKYFRRAAEILRRYPSIHARAFLIIGLPGETVAQIKDTFDLCREMQLDWCHVNIYNALPNTAAYAVSDNYVETDLTNFRFNSTAYGRHYKPDQNLPNSFAATCEGLFAGRDLNYIPHRQELDLIWVYMNYYINFIRLQQPMPQEKLRQQEQFVLNIVNTIDPENAIAYWYAAHLQRRLRGAVDPDLLNRLNGLLDRHDAWRRRFAELGLEPVSCGLSAAE